MIYFLSLNSMSLSSFPDLIKFGRYMEMPSISAVNDYETYENAVSGREFLLAIVSVLEDKLIEEVNTSPFFSIMVDESTDRALESHLITYVTYLEGDGIGQPKIQFLNLQGLPNGTAISIFEAWKKTSNKYDLVPLGQIKVLWTRYWTFLSIKIIQVFFNKRDVCIFDYTSNMHNKLSLVNKAYVY
jgi:hypothetical protein